MTRSTIELSHAQSIVELAETIKEFVRVIQAINDIQKQVSPSLAIPDYIAKRLNDVYNKASRAKNRMDV
jgi:hypothetical protein